jgi:hypothetical protein
LRLIVRPSINLCVLVARARTSTRPARHDPCAAPHPVSPWPGRQDTASTPPGACSCSGYNGSEGPSSGSEPAPISEFRDFRAGIVRASVLKEDCPRKSFAMPARLRTALKPPPSHKPRCSMHNQGPSTGLALGTSDSPAGTSPVQGYSNPALRFPLPPTREQSGRRPIQQYSTGLIAVHPTVGASPFSLPWKIFTHLRGYNRARRSLPFCNTVPARATRLGRVKERS